MAKPFEPSAASFQFFPCNRYMGNFDGTEGTGSKIVFFAQKLRCNSVCFTVRSSYKYFLHNAHVTRHASRVAYVSFDHRFSCIATIKNEVHRPWRMEILKYRFFSFFSCVGLAKF